MATDHRDGPWQYRQQPFGSSLVIMVTGASEDLLIVEVYDLCGRLVGRPALTTGRGQDRSAVWNGLDSSGEPLPAGTYMIRLPGQGEMVRRVVKLD